MTDSNNRIIGKVISKTVMNGTEDDQLLTNWLQNMTEELHLRGIF